VSGDRASGGSMVAGVDGGRGEERRRIEERGKGEREAGEGRTCGGGRRQRRRLDDDTDDGSTAVGTADRRRQRLSRGSSRFLAVYGERRPRTTKSWNAYPRRFGVNAGGNFHPLTGGTMCGFHRRKHPIRRGYIFFPPSWRYNITCVNHAL
jgi:hypothetical protein